MVEDKLIWNGVKERITTKITNQDFKTSCSIDVALFPEKKEELAHSFQAFSDIRIENLGIH